MDRAVPRWIQWRGPREFIWRHVNLPVADLAEELTGLRILHLSDFHTRNKWTTAYDTLLNRIANDPPDLILFTGDFVESRRNHMPAVPHVKRLVEGFRARLGCFGTLGNHDLYHFAPHLEGTNVTLLEGGRKLLTLPNAAIELIGFPGVHPIGLDRHISPLIAAAWRAHVADRDVPFSQSPAPRPASWARSLFLTGHTHGGQVCLPGGHPIITHSTLPRRLCRGIHRSATPGWCRTAAWDIRDCRCGFYARRKWWS